MFLDAGAGFCNFLLVSECLAASLPTVRLVSDLKRVRLLFDTSRRLRIGEWGWWGGFGFFDICSPSLPSRDVLLSTTPRASHLNTGIAFFVAWLIILRGLQLQMVPGGEWEVRDVKIMKVGRIQLSHLNSYLLHNTQIHKYKYTNTNVTNVTTIHLSDLNSSELHNPEIVSHDVTTIQLSDLISSLLHNLAQSGDKTSQSFSQ